ncbi:hypothetical protein B0H19DRAFT_1274304 [Mycena capillaripes]|nr:hypothetical protein B0H19DRAFT_1274304 [Mycena capillaripes]
MTKGREATVYPQNESTSTRAQEHKKRTEKPTDTEDSGNVFEKRVAALEGSVVVVVTASGQSAQLLALTALAESADAAANLYSGTNNQLKVTFRELSAVHRCVDPNGVLAAIDGRTRAMYSRLS